MKDNYLKDKSFNNFDLELGEGGEATEKQIAAEPVEYNCCLKIVFKIMRKMYPALPKQVPTL